MSKIKFTKDSQKFLALAFDLYADYAAMLDAGSKGKEDAPRGKASDAISLCCKAFAKLENGSAILAFNKGKDELGGKALKLIARQALADSKSEKEAFASFLAEIEKRILAMPSA